MNVHSTVDSKIIPFSLKDAPSFIENQFPVGRISAESYKERKAGAGQTLTALGSYWKGRKPLILVRATVLGCLLPSTDDYISDLKVFLCLMGMDDVSFPKRIKSIKPSDIKDDCDQYVALIQAGENGRPRWKDDLSKQSRDALLAEWLISQPYDARLNFTFRPEELNDQLISRDGWEKINQHLGTSATSVPMLIEQLGIMRFGRKLVVGDSFSGSGSIPFEAARLGCDAIATDLNPISCLLSWGAFNIIGASSEQRQALEAAQVRAAKVVDAELVRLGIEHDEVGNRAKAYIYCLETRCPKTGWMVPISPSWVISRARSVVARLKPDYINKRYDIVIEEAADAAALAAAEFGTLQDGRLVHPENPEKDGVAISVIRGDHKIDGRGANRLRPWEKSEFRPREEDIFQERIYCILWIKKETIAANRQTTFFRGVTAWDLTQEHKVNCIVQKNLSEWQANGLVPDARILPGAKTDEPIRTRGWTHWHHLFSSRHLLINSLYLSALRNMPSQFSAGLLVAFCKTLDSQSKMTRWRSLNKTANITGGLSDKIENVFYNQALNTMYNYGQRAWSFLDFSVPKTSQKVSGSASIRSKPATGTNDSVDLWITDPPYADAVNYHEITEYFIAWLKNSPPEPFANWHWDSQRDRAIKGTDEKFRSEMAAAYRVMAEHMPETGLQVVMFTHQDAGVWADLAAIMWSAGLRVTAAWNIVTETESALKEGNYVQGTILLVLRKRLHADNIKRMDIEGEIEEAVDDQLAALHNLDEDWTSERLYTDGDLQLAAYAAALRVITGYATIDRKEVGADVYRKLAKGEKTVIRELIEYAASVANNKLVPEGFPPAMWRDLDAPSRFYVRMLDMESKGTTKFADYQDFARTFSVADYADLMDSTKANAASLAGAGVLKARMLTGKGFGTSPLRRVLFATHKTMQKDDPREGLAFLKMELGQDYWPNRAKLVALAKYVSAKTARTRPIESSAADLLAQRLEVDKV